MTLDSNNPENPEDGIDLKRYLSLFWQWAWLFVLAAVVEEGQHMQLAST